MRSTLFMAGLIGAGLVTLVLAPASARDIWVDNLSGADKNIGQEPSNLANTSGPVRTIAKAVRLAEPGDRIVLVKTGKPFCECVTLSGSRRSGNAMFPLIFDGSGGTLDGSQAIPPEHWQQYRGEIFRFRPLDMDYPMLFLDGQSLRPKPVKTGVAAPPELKPLEWCAIGGAVYFAVEKGKLPADYKLSRAALPAGISLYHVDHVQIQNVIIRGYRLDGVATLEDARNVVLKNVACINNGRNGVNVAGVSLVELDRCALGGNATAQLLTSPYNEVYIYESTLSSDTAPGWVDYGARVYLGGRLVSGGKRSILPEEAPRKPDKMKIDKPRIDN